MKQLFEKVLPQLKKLASRIPGIDAKQTGRHTGTLNKVVVGRQLGDLARQRALKQQKKVRMKETQRAKRFKTAQRRRLAVIVVGVLLIAGFIGSRFFVFNVAVSGSATDEQRIAFEATANEYFSGLSSRFKPNFDIDAFTEHFVAATSSISSAKSSLSTLSTSVEVQIEARSNTVGWIDVRRDAYFLIDSQGIAYERVDVLPPNIPVITDVSGIEVVTGDTVTSVSNVDFIREIHHASAPLGIQTSGFIIGEATRNIEATLSGYNFRVRFTTNRGATEQLDDLHPVLALLTGEQRLPLEYIDVRVADRVFYK